MTGAKASNEIQQVAFGPRESQMEAEFQTQMKRYIDTGTTDTPQKQTEWVKSYTLGYVAACTEFYVREFPRCEPLDGEERTSCAQRLDASYQEMIQATLMESSLLEKKPLDAATVTLAVMERAHRRYEAGELLSTTINAAMAPPKTTREKLLGNASDEKAWTKVHEGFVALQRRFEGTDFAFSDGGAPEAEIVSALKEIRSNLPTQHIDQAATLDQLMAAIDTRNKTEALRLLQELAK